MADLQYYLDRADEDQRHTLQCQWREIHVERQVTCPCGLVRTVYMAFRCLYCGIFFCVTCAEKHFGKTRAGYEREPEPERGFISESERWTLSNVIVVAGFAFVLGLILGYALP